MVGADTRKEREPNRRLVRGTWRSFDEEERRPLMGTAGKGKMVSRIQRQILRLKYTKFDFRWDSAPDPAGGAYTLSETP